MSTTKRRGANSTYFGDIIESVRSLSKGLSLTLKHVFHATKRRNNSYVSDPDYFKDKTGLVTLQYPYESIPVPDNGRYRLHNEIDDCIVCDKCAKICPVDCITIESIKATEEIGKTSDGTSKRLYAPIFDIDLAKCCYCGLCTTVCPTECLTMTKAYDFSEVDVDNFVYKFSDMLQEEADQKRKELELANAQKEAAKAAKVVPLAKPEVQAQTQAAPSPETTEAKPAARPAFKPKVKSLPAQEGLKETESAITNESKSDEAPNAEMVAKPAASKPVFRPKIKTGQPPAGPATEETESKSTPETLSTETKAEGTLETEEKPVAQKPVFKPKIRPGQTAPASVPKEELSENKSAITPDPMETKPESETKPTARPIFRPKIRTGQTEETAKPEPSKEEQSVINETEDKAKRIEPVSEGKASASRPVFKPKVRPVIPAVKKEESKEEETQMEAAKPLSAIENTEEAKLERPQSEEPMPEINPENKAITNRPVFRPKIRAPKPPEDPNKPE
jgi:formate hydrogenlyase subunit 6/NADH:ubiquinone oxidoreductase subunit I